MNADDSLANFAHAHLQREHRRQPSSTSSSSSLLSLAPSLSLSLPRAAKAAASCAVQQSSVVIGPCPSLVFNTLSARAPKRSRRSPACMNQSRSNVSCRSADVDGIPAKCCIVSDQLFWFTSSSKCATRRQNVCQFMQAAAEAHLQGFSHPLHWLVREATVIYSPHQPFAAPAVLLMGLVAVGKL